MNSDERITYFASTDSRNTHVPFGIKAKDRSRHMYVIGKTGMGKSTLLENLAIQDIKNGEGLTFIDPHGGTAEKLLDFIPEERIKDVLYFAPFDLENPISFNVLERVEGDKRHLVVNGLMATFEKIWVDAWSARMSYILQNTLLALLEYPEATLLGVNRMYTDKEFRKVVVENITDPSVKSFWVDEYAKYTDKFAAEATPAIQNKIGQFYSSAIVRNIIGQPQSSFNLREIMDKKKIFIVNLSKGRVGEGNANLLGSMLITKIYLAAMSRADVPGPQQKMLPNHYLYVDEFQSFANKSFADILSEARKYKLALTIAHQYIEQMEEEVRAAVFGNVGTMISFRVGSYDAEILEKEFAPVFLQEDIVNLGFSQIYLKLMIDGVSSQPFSANTLPPIEQPSTSHRDQVIAYSRSAWSQPRTEVEERIKEWHKPIVSTATAIKLEEKAIRREEKREEKRTTEPEKVYPWRDEPRRTPQKPAYGIKETLSAQAPSRSAPPRNERQVDIHTEQRGGIQEQRTERDLSREERGLPMPARDYYKESSPREDGGIRSNPQATAAPLHPKPSSAAVDREYTPSPASKNALREALKKLAEKKEATSSTSKEVRSHKEIMPRPHEQVRERTEARAEIGEPHKLKREIPEDILKKLIDVDEKDLR